MTFRKNSFLFYESEISYIAIIIVCVVLIELLGVVWYLLGILPLVVLILVNPIMHNEFITINENGISCWKSGKNMWKYEWNSISQLKRSSRFRMPSIEIIGYNKYGEAEQYAIDGHYFQFGKTAKKAIEKYYNPGQR